MASDLRGLLAYGSLIHPDEYRALPGLIAAIPVRVQGYRRIFNQTPSWRKGEGKRIAVLNVIPSPVDSINAICLVLASETLSTLARRERGYVLEEVPDARLSFDRAIDAGSFPERFLIYRGRVGLQDHTLLANPEYLNLCMEGAKSWGENFYRLFLKSTYINAASSA